MENTDKSVANAENTENVNNADNVEAVTSGDSMNEGSQGYPFGNGCPLYATEECRMLNMQTCKDCTVNGSSAEEMERIKSEIAFMRGLLPENGIDKLFTGDKCLFCKDEPNDKTCYALLDIGNKEPAHREKLKQALSGTKDSGSIIPLQISCCDECKKRLSRLGLVRAVFATAVIGATLILMSLRAVHEPLMAVFTALPLVIFLISIAVGFVGGSMLQSHYKKEYERKTQLHVMELEEMKGLKERGWFVLYKDEPATKLVFSEERLKQGLFTGENH